MRKRFKSISIKYFKRLLIIIPLIIASIFIVFPFYWLFVSSVRPSGELFAVPARLIPNRVSFDFYIHVFMDTFVPKYFINSLIVAIITTTSTLIISILGAYSLTRYRYPGRELIARLVLFAYMFPGIIILIPLYLFVLRLHLTNSPFGLALVYLTFTTPFCLWMLRAYFAELPIELEESAMVDGCTKLGAFIRVLLPIGMPGIIAAGLFSFILSWNEYMFALVFITKERVKTLPLGIAGFLGALYHDWGGILASGVIAALPIVVAFMFFQKYLVQGIAAGAIKG